MANVVEENIHFYGSYWTIYDDGQAYEGGTGRQYPGGAEALRGEMLLDRMARAARSLGDLTFRWRVSALDYRRLLQAPTMIGRSLVVEHGPAGSRAFGMNLEVHPDLPQGTVEIVAEVPQ